jgi:cytoskeletal protein CcmA (bactofilin family)
MAMGSAKDESLVNSIVGAGTHIRGDVQLSGLLRIDGDFTGSVASEGKVIIGTNGRADCSIRASVVVIGGIIRGSVYADQKILLLSSAIVIGNLYAPRLVAEEGTAVHGQCIVTGDSHTLSDRVNRHQFESGRRLFPSGQRRRRGDSDSAEEAVGGYGWNA